MTYTNIAYASKFATVLISYENGDINKTEYEQKIEELKKENKEDPIKEAIPIDEKPYSQAKDDFDEIRENGNDSDLISYLENLTEKPKRRKRIIQQPI